MYKICHEPTNISPSVSNFTFPELDHLPLTIRRSLLVSSDRVSQRITASVPASNNVDNIVKREDEDCFNEMGVVSNCDDAKESVDIEISESISIGCSLNDSGNLSQHLNDSGNLSQQNNILVCCSNPEEDLKRVEQIEVTARSDALEHLTLKERRKLLLDRMALRLPESNLENNTQDCDETDLYNIKPEISCENGIASSSGVQFSGFLEKVDFVLCKKFSIGSESRCQLSGIQERKPIAHERSFDLSLEASLPELSSRDDEHSLLASKGYAAAAAKTPRKSVKRVQRNPLPLNVNEIQLIQVKVESFGDCVMDMENNCERNPVTSEKVQVKRDVETHDEAHDENELDGAKLSYRLNLRTSAPILLGHHEDLSSPSSGFSFCASDEYVKPLRIFRPWKRKKTATDSTETALEEDSPGLLQVLIQLGVSVDELRHYGENEGGSDSSDDSLLDESFSELEDVISQLFFKRETGIKLLNLKLSKASRPSYCLTCLFSLIEQARYLRFRKWLVEWDWCRDLQSFIFVSERHNRIVMERPEYGYATYFFELSNTASIRWQIKRLVLAMKLASCGRYQLIENKPLLVGEDMMESEAEVLMKYGWVANTDAKLPR